MLINLIRKPKPFSQELEPCAKLQPGEATGRQLQGQSQQLTQHKGTAGGPQHLPQPHRQQWDPLLQWGRRSPGSAPAHLPWLVFTGATGPSARWTRLSCVTLGSDTASELPAPQPRGWALSTRTNHAGSCTWTAAPKHRELQAALLSTPEMLSKKLLQYSLHNPVSVGCHEECSLESSRSSHISQEQKLAVGRVGQRTCLLSPSLLCWTPLLCTPSQHNEQLSLPSWQGNGKISMP